MNDLEENVFRLGDGVDVYNPDVTSDELRFKRLKNLQPFRGRLKAANGFVLVDTIGSSRVLAFAFCTEPYALYSSLFAFTETGIYAYDFVNDEFDSTAIYTWPSGTGPIAIAPWYSSVYATRKGAPLVRLVGAVATIVADAPGGRYLKVSNSHLMIANLAFGTENYPNRVRWSDIYLPELWEITSASEADFFELEPSDGEITGLTYQRGNNLIYTRPTIWIARYNPIPVGYRFEPLYTDVGSSFHGGVISVKERDFFIGADNIYEIDGLQLKEIGDPIWAFFKEDCITNPVTGFLSTRVIKQQHSVAWIYNKLGGGYWSIVYNYKQKSWSDRDPQDVFASLYLEAPLRGFIPINDVTSIINDPPNDTNLINGDWQFPTSTLSELHGGSDGDIFDSNATFEKATAGVPIACEAETFEFYVDSLFDKKEFDSVNLHFSGLGLPNIQLYVGTRENRLQAVTWSAAIELYDQLSGETAFNFRGLSGAVGQGKLIRFKFSWNNYENNYVDELTNISFSKLNDGPDQPDQ